MSEYIPESTLFSLRNTLGDDPASQCWKVPAMHLLAKKKNWWTISQGFESAYIYIYIYLIYIEMIEEQTINK